MTTAQSPRIFKDGETVNELATFEKVQIEARKLRSGMLVLDPELDCPLWAIDHRVKAARNSGSMSWMVEDFENGGHKTVTLSPSALVPVAV